MNLCLCWTNDRYYKIFCFELALLLVYGAVTPSLFYSSLNNLAGVFDGTLLIIQFIKSLQKTLVRYRLLRGGRFGQ